MDAETRKKVEEIATKINDSILAQMMNEEKNDYDSEIRLPNRMTNEKIVIKKSYNLENRENSGENKKRRESRISTLEKCIIDQKYEEAEEKIQKQHYMALTELALKNNDCNEKTSYKIMKSMFAMIGYDVAMIPKTMVDETITIIKKWIPHSKTIYGYISRKIKPLDMSQEEMIYVYDTYILVKKIILIDCINKEDYDKRIARLNKELTPVYAAIRALKAIE